jgi:hypothetical protein
VNAPGKEFLWDQAVGAGSFMDSLKDVFEVVARRGYLAAKEIESRRFAVCLARPERRLLFFIKLRCPKNMASFFATSQSWLTSYPQTSTQAGMFFSSRMLLMQRLLSITSSQAPYLHKS